MAYQLQSVETLPATGTWVGRWLDEPFGFHRGPAVSLQAASAFELRLLAERRGLPWAGPCTAPDQT